MTRRPTKNSNDDEESITAKSILLCNGHNTRPVTRQSSQELLKVQCNGLSSNPRSFKLLSPSGSDVLPLPSSKRATRRASASWCGSTRELSQLSPISVSELENIRRSGDVIENTKEPESPGITLRPKGQLWLPVALIGTTAEEHGNGIRKRHESSKHSDKDRTILRHDSDSNDSLYSSKRSSKQGSENSLCSKQSEETYCIITRHKQDELNKQGAGSEENEVLMMPGAKKRSLSMVLDTSRVENGALKRLRANSVLSLNNKKKKLSPEEKLLQDNKEYFKMEVLNTKLRSSDCLINSNHNSESNDTDDKKIEKIIIKKIKVKKGKGKQKTKTVWSETLETNDNNEEKPPVNGIIKKIRKTELMKLCDEAENFMFGESSRQDSTTTADSDVEGDDKRKKWNYEDSSIDSNTSWDKPRKKRRSHAEAFIHDNLDYYKFETPGSRLRYHGSFLDIKPESELIINMIKTEDGEEVKEKRKGAVRPSEELEKIKFSFESVPQTEPWFNVYNRQDQGMENYYPTISNPDDQLFLLPYEMPRSLFAKTPEENDYYRRRRRRLAHLLANHPRKSPRCHASTLAILSSLKKRKRRSGTNISMQAIASTSEEVKEEPPPPPPVPPPLLIPKVEPEITEDLDQLLEILNDEDDEFDDELLLEPFEEEEKTLKIRGRRITRQESKAELDSDELHFDEKQYLKVVTEEESNIILTKKNSEPSMNVLQLIETFKSCRSMEEPDCEYKNDISSECDSGSVIGVSDSQDMKRSIRKRRVNRTGWDKKVRKRMAFNNLVNKKNKNETKDKNGEGNRVISNRKGRCLRSSDVIERRISQDSESISLSDSVASSLDYSPCVVKMKKISVPQTVKLRTDHKIEKLKIKKKLIMSKRCKGDVSWTTDRGRRR